MADRKDFYFRQKVTEAELDSAFDGLEVADRAIMDDQSLIGICNGLVASQAAPTPDISVDITAGVGYDQAGQRMFVPTLTNVDVSVDLNSTSTDVVGGGNSRIVGVYLEFQRVLSDPRIDGNSNTVFFQRDESFAFVVRQGAEAASPSPPPLQADEILVVDITRTFGQTQIFNADLDFSRTELMFVGSSTNLSFSERTAVAALTTVLQEIDDHIVSTTAHGSDDIDSVAVVGTPNSLALGDVLSQLTELLGFANDLAPSELTYSSNDTWNKPTNAVWVLGVVVGAGGGGGAEGATGGGAGGGGSGEVKTFSFPAVEVPSSLTVTIGAVGTGASVAEQQGGQGGLCSIQATNFLVSAAGGNGGIGGSGNVGAAGGAGGRSFYTLVGDPGAGGSPGGLGEPAVTGLGGAGGGGGGDGIGPAAGGTGGGGIGGNGGVGGSGGNGGFGGIGYGAGGGGGMTTPTTGGGGGGGGGGYTSKTGGSGFVAAQDGNSTKGGNGGSGVVIIITLRATNTI